MNMRVNLETSTNNLLYLDYMQKKEQEHTAKSTENRNNSCCTQVLPQDEKED